RSEKGFQALQRLLFVDERTDLLVRHEPAQRLSPELCAEDPEQISGDEWSLIITEIYVPCPDVPYFLAQAVDLLRSNRTTVIYGTVRLIEKDDRAFLHGP